MTQGVTEIEPGTMPDAKGIEAPEAKGKTPAPRKVSPEDELRYSQNQLDDFVQRATSEAGRLKKEAEMERDTLKSQIQTKESELGSIQAERDSLQTQIEGLTENDPKKFDLVKQDKQLRERERTLTASLGTLEERERKVAEREEKVNSFNASVLIETIADEYEGGDTAQLKKMCATAGATTEESIREVATILWGKAKAPSGEKKTPPVKKVPGNTEGGGTESLEELQRQAQNLKGKTPAQIADIKKKLLEAQK